MPAAFAVDGAPAEGIGELVADPSRHTPATARAAFDVDVVLPLLHGPYGEDGTVQGLFELADLPYVGSGVLGSAVAMDKIMMKRAFAAADLPTPQHVSFREGHDLDAFMDDVERVLGYPCFVKPANMGSSVGVSKAGDRTQLRASCDEALGFDEWILAEEAIVGREIELAVLGDDPPEVSVPGEVVPGDEFYSYADKYESDAAELLAPAPLTDEQTRQARDIAVACVRGVPLRSDGARRPVLRRAGPRLPRQRGEHDPGIHADLDVPAPLAGLRPRVPAPHRAVDRPRTCPSRAPHRPRG